MQMLDLRGFRERYTDVLRAIFTDCPAPDRQPLITAVVDEDEARHDMLKQLLNGADFLVGKYTHDNKSQALELTGIGDMYYNWLTTK